MRIFVFVNSLCLKHKVCNNYQIIKSFENQSNTVLKMQKFSLLPNQEKLQVSKLL